MPYGVFVLSHAGGATLERRRHPAALQRRLQTSNDTVQCTCAIMPAPRPIRIPSALSCGGLILAMSERLCAQHAPDQCVRRKTHMRQRPSALMVSPPEREQPVPAKPTLSRMAFPVRETGMDLVHTSPGCADARLLHPASR